MAKLTQSYVHGASSVPLIGQTVGAFFDEAARRWGQCVALIVRHQSVRWTYEQLKRKVEDFAAGLLALGLKSGDRVGIWSPNNAEWVVTQFATAKAGLIQLSLCLAHEWGPRVRVIPLVAGLIETEQAHLHYGDQAGLASVGNTIALRRMGRPEDIGDVCVFLCSPLARWMSGGPVYVDGGGEGPAFQRAAINVRKDPREA